MSIQGKHVLLVSATIIGLMFTGTSNYHLLMEVSVDKTVAVFGLIFMDGGILLWEWLYHLSTKDLHRWLCIAGVGMDIVLSTLGVFYAMNRDTFPVPAPSITSIVSLGIVVNVSLLVAMSFTQEKRDCEGLHSPQQEQVKDLTHVSYVQETLLPMSVNNFTENVKDFTEQEQGDSAIEKAVKQRRVRKASLNGQSVK